MTMMNPPGPPDLDDDAPDAEVPPAGDEDAVTPASDDAPPGDEGRGDERN